MRMTFYHYNDSFSENRMSTLDHRQAERTQLIRAQTLPKTSAAHARKAIAEKLEKDTGR